MREYSQKFQPEGALEYYQEERLTNPSCQCNSGVV